MIVVDVETTGLYENKNSIVSIGAVEFENPANQFYRACRIWDGAEVSEQALGINGFTKEQINDASKPLEGIIVKEFIDWGLECGEITLAGENPSFDMKFLNAALGRHNKTIWDKRCEWIRECKPASEVLVALYDRSPENQQVKWSFGYRTVDVHTISYASFLVGGKRPPVKNKKTSVSLDSALVDVGMNPEPIPHNALTGAKLEAEVLSRLLYGKNLLPEYKHNPVPFKYVVRAKLLHKIDDFLSAMCKA